MLWTNIGIRKPQELVDIDWEDVSGEGITKIQFKALQRIGREHAAPNSDSTTLPPPTPGGETAQGKSGRDCECSAPALTSGLTRCDAAFKTNTPRQQYKSSLTPIRTDVYNTPPP